MSILDLDKIDSIGVKDDTLILLIIDYLDWQYEDMHLEQLQEKINNYLIFIQNKQYLEHYDGIQNIVISIQFKFKLSQKAKQFIEIITKQLSEFNISLKIESAEK